jgi:hypothetical protein
LIQFARHTSGKDQLRRQEVLYERHPIWLSDDRFAFAGFEHVQVDRKTVHCTQS